MSYTVRCDCGRSLAVNAGDAGAQKTCACGSVVAVPSLSMLRESAEPSIAAEPTEESFDPAILFSVTAVLALAAGIYSRPLLLLLGVLIVVVGRLWLAAQIMREMYFGDALLVFFVPFMPTVFLIKRLDITWRPFCYGAFGHIIICAVVGLSR